MAATFCALLIALCLISSIAETQSTICSTRYRRACVRVRNFPVYMVVLENCFNVSYSLITAFFYFDYRWKVFSLVSLAAISPQPIGYNPISYIKIQQAITWQKCQSSLKVEDFVPVFFVLYSSNKTQVKSSYFLFLIRSVQVRKKS